MENIKVIFFYGAHIHLYVAWDGGRGKVLPVRGICVVYGVHWLDKAVLGGGDRAKAGL